MPRCFEDNAQTSFARRIALPSASHTMVQPISSERHLSTVLFELLFDVQDLAR
jgi:hypothetical protein